jgi:hypothetical protein
MMFPSTDSWTEWKSRGLAEQERLCACLNAMLSCELVCAIAADVAETLEEAAFGNRSSAVLVACGEACHRAARAIAGLTDPDVAAVAEELEACRVACAAARAECARRPFDQCCRVCAEQCERCEIECIACLSLVAVAA